MLTGKQKSFLRAKAHHEKPLFQIGKGGVNENLMTQLDDLLDQRELIKVAVLQNCLEEKDDIVAQLFDGTDACLVQIIGHTIVLYRDSVENKTITLPN